MNTFVGEAYDQIREICLRTELLCGVSGGVAVRWRPSCLSSGGSLSYGGGDSFSSDAVARVFLYTVPAAKYIQITVYKYCRPAPDSAPEPVDDPELKSRPRGLVFDVTHHGAVDDGDSESSSGFLAAWKAACDHGERATFYVPEGKYHVGPVEFSGPCKNNQSPKIVIRGNLIAPSKLQSFPSKTWIQFSHLNRFSITGDLDKTNFDARGAVEAWKQHSCQHSSRCKTLIPSLKFDHVSHGTIRNISLSNAKGFHLVIHESSNVNVHNVIVSSPEDSPNTDGIHVSHSSNINISSSTIGVGDDCVSIIAGSVNVTVYDVTCNPGHGISIGSLGKTKNEEDVSGISVKKCKIKKTKNGIRIKTWAGSTSSNAYNMTFDDIELTDVSNPIIIDQKYCPNHKCDTSKPSKVKIKDVTFKNVRGTYKSDYAVSLLCSPSVPCENVKLVDINLTPTHEEDDEDWREGNLNLNGAIDGLQVINSNF
ncbi:exopolygalacturonase-like [Tripterygium wilfordii]|uniref:exopolygalacturonase-like n=1 Tax=Tripterygium wilfordii TaxID=458696 RepID=UPI0018F836AF|nr:exopolygalacturonase-like [Tripterygium wilfordii]